MKPGLVYENQKKKKKSHMTHECTALLGSAVPYRVSVNYDNTVDTGLI